MAAVPVTTATDYSDASSSSSSSSSLPNWVMLDPYVFKRYDLSTFQEDETTSPQRRTSEGVSFRVSPLPAVSRLYLHFPKSPGGSDTICRIVGSHRNTLLFCLYVPLPLPVDKYPADFPYERQPRFCRQDLFVYTAGSPPSLNLLPPCHETLVEDEEDDTSSEELYDPLAGVVNFSELEGIGEDEGKFTMMFADVRPLDGYVYLPRSNGFEFNLWSLIMEEDGNMNWKHEQEFGFSHKDLNIRNFIPSPCGPLTFPVVSMEEPHVGYFVVGEPGCGIRKGIHRQGLELNETPAPLEYH
ncbi:hypothetical protein PR202_ga02405 [Eleusine coracana subsp. coracana]|uniref:Uncharacterized protein n=1 Tax=Eleusine coracana subsp. coracana TaxID=191504 RepID=A0AAV5BKS3_ELECO|nr:hypothetical protein PR202_ga02405 [Eleusine coracana subsp. coracana]